MPSYHNLTTHSLLILSGHHQTSNPSSPSSIIIRIIMPSPYPNRFQIEEMFANRVNTDAFHSYFADNFSVTVVGQDFHLGAHHTSTDTFNEILTRIVDHLKRETIKVEVMRVIGGEESAWAAVETLGTAITKTGE